MFPRYSDIRLTSTRFLLFLEILFNISQREEGVLLSHSVPPFPAVSHDVASSVFLDFPRPRRSGRPSFQGIFYVSHVDRFANAKRDEGGRKETRVDDLSRRVAERLNRGLKRGDREVSLRVSTAALEEEYINGPINGQTARFPPLSHSCARSLTLIQGPEKNGFHGSSKTRRGEVDMPKGNTPPRGFGLPTR